MAAQPTAWLCSHPKSGRTWMRFALVQLLDSLHGLDGGFDMLNMFGLIPNSDGEGKTQPTKTPDNYRYSDRSDVPFIVMSHLPWESPFSELPAVFLVRSPGDVLVSYYHHMNRHDGRFQGTLDEFARLDLSRMDFSEVYAEFTDAARLPDELQTSELIQQKIRDYYERSTP